MRLILASVFAAGVATATLSAQELSFSMLESPVLLYCGAHHDQALFRATVNEVDAQGNPRPIVGADDPKQFKVVEDGQPQRFHPVLRVSPRATGAGAKGSYVMLLLDTSGSMLLPKGQSKFELAKEQIKKSLASFKTDQDHIAIAPFNSHQVVARIQAAPFESTAQGVEGLVDRVPKPADNTGLFSAVVAALPILQTHRDEGFAVALIILSDGENDVQHPGDDPGLLQEQDGLRTAVDQIKSARVPVYTVGFGVSDNATVQEELRSMAYPNAANFFQASIKSQDVSNILQLVSQKQADQIQLLFGPVRPSRQELRSQDLKLSVVWTTPKGQVQSKEPMIWHAGASSDPVPQAACTDPESAVWPADAAPNSWERLIVFASLAGLIAALWFGAPRLMWPDAYLRRPTLPPLPQQNVPGLQAPPAPQMQVPNWERFKRPQESSQPPPARAGGVRPGPPDMRGAPPDHTVVISGRPTPRPTPQRRPPAPDDGRDADDKTVYMPPPNDPYKKR